jgi:hypothetical protein
MIWFLLRMMAQNWPSLDSVLWVVALVTVALVALVTVALVALVTVALVALVAQVMAAWIWAHKWITGLLKSKFILVITTSEISRPHGLWWIGVVAPTR